MDLTMCHLIKSMTCVPILLIKHYSSSDVCVSLLLPFALICGHHAPVQCNRIYSVFTYDFAQAHKSSLVFGVKTDGAYKS